MPHMRMRIQLPMLKMSLMAPMVQKLVRWARAPKTTQTANEAHSTCV